MKMELHPLIVVAFVLAFALTLGSWAQSKGHIKHLEHQIELRDSVNSKNAKTIQMLNDSIEKYEPIIIYNGKP